jgi:hypothetical protein
MTITTPLSIPVDSYVPRKASVETLGDIIGGRGIRFLVVELKSDAEADAVTDWIGRRMPPPPYGGPI